MVFTISSKTAIQKIKSSDQYKTQYVIDVDGQVLHCALIVNGDLSKPLLYDFSLNNITSLSNWYINNGGYASSSEAYMHRLIASHTLNDYNNDKPIEHIDDIKLDNRTKNLRMVVQNKTTTTRSDKKPPCEELIAAGVTELPKHVRWDKIEHKFIIEKHPALVREVAEGTRKRPYESGTKSTKLTIMQKFQDILARLEKLDMVMIDPEWKQIAIQNKNEYNEIVKAICEYENIPPPIEEVMETLAITSNRNTAPGRKTVSKLPPDCGVTVEQIPRYCYYIAKTDKRGDKFVIDKHPLLEKRVWSTTSSNSFSTLAKFKMLMDKIKNLTNE